VKIDGPIQGRDVENVMSFCDHCEGQRFDRAQVLRILRATRKKLQKPGTRCSVDQSLAMAIEAVRALEIPHLERLEDLGDDQVVH
jgi:imidazolonepropionase-like amidohydrolase